MSEQNVIWSDRPAECWEEVHPIGNGSLGGMIWGGTTEEHIGLNMDTLWSGYARDTNNYEARAYLERAREEIFQGQYHQAAQIVEEHLLGEFGENYLPMGDLIIRVESGDTVDEDMDAADYRRELNLDGAVASVFYMQNGAACHREYFASYPDQMIGMRFSGEKPMRIVLRLYSELSPKVRIDKSGVCEALYMQGQCPEHVEPSYLESEDPIIWGNRGIRFAVRVSVLATDGTVSGENDQLTIEGATFCELTLQAVSGNRENPLHIPEFANIDKTYSELKETHICDYQKLFERVEIKLGETPDMTTEMRLQRLREGVQDDPQLFALFFQYGRYLLIASSREGSEPANLQGIWNWQMRAPWSANYTTNINVEMNYWPAQVCNLTECMEPYYRLLSELVPNGERTARVHFGCRGFCVGHNTDYWRITNPVGVPYGQKKGVPGSSLYAFFVLSGHWMCQELWKAYTYGRDMDFLAQTVYPVLKKAALFLVDWLVEYDGYYVTAPSTSPENQFETPEGISAVSMGTTMDMCIVRETFTNYRSAYRALKEAGRIVQTDGELGDEELMEQVAERMEHLLPARIGADGRLLEWMYPFAETEPGHRHISHAYGLFPGEEFRRNEELKRACQKSIVHRLANGGGHTGWSCAWIANLFAVLSDGEQAYAYMKTLLTHSTCPNLWTSHPPFQIDANFAGTQAIANMLVQELDGQLEILPAIPKAWKRGYVRGLRLTGNRSLDIRWDGEQIWTRIHEKIDTECT